jgi:hypothetical protein
VKFPRLLPIDTIASTLVAALAPMMERRSENQRLTLGETTSLLCMADAIRRVEDEAGPEEKSEAPVAAPCIGHRKP